MIAVTLVVGSALAVATTLDLRSLPEVALAVYVLALAEIVGLMLVLSAFGTTSRIWILGASALLFAVSATRWLVLGAPRPAPRARVAQYLLALRRDWLVFALAVVTGFALLYVLALIVGTPPNNGDSLSYHLTRAAFWRQTGGIGYVVDAYDERLNVNPPNAEIVFAFLFELGRNERLAGLVQFTAAIALSLGVYALARRLMLSQREAAFGALLFLTLPIVLLQASTTQNDLVAASFLLAAAVFVLGHTRYELILAALAVALAIGTKVPAAYGLPILGVLALAASPGTYRARRLAALTLGAAVGAYWYVVNIVHTGRPLGQLPEVSGLVSFLEPTQNLLASFARVLDALDFSGAEGADVLLYVVVAIGTAIVLIFTQRDVMPGHRRHSALLSGALVIVPVALLLLMSYAAWRVFAKIHYVLDAPDGHYPVTGWDAQTRASESQSWFGPVGFIFAVAAIGAAVLLFRRPAFPRLALVFAMAPLVTFALFSISLAYDPWQGRFFVFPVALSAAVWGVILRARRYAVAAGAIAATTAALALIHSLEKPSGLRLFERAVPRSVWGVERWEAQSVHQPETPLAALRFLAELPRAASVALALGFNDFGYPAFGPSLSRRVELVPLGSSARNSSAEWLLANSDRASKIDRECWDAMLTTPEGWIGFRRRAGACE